MPARQPAPERVKANARAVPIPAPYGGINTRDGRASLQPFEARDMINWEPFGSKVTPRPGNTLQSSDSLTTSVETLNAFQGLSGSNLIGINAGSIYDYSSNPAVLLSASGFAKSRFQTECYNNRLIGVNGTDTPWVFNGSTIAATGFTGPTLTSLNNIRKVRNRLWFCLNNSADVYYGALSGITGALTLFSLSQVVGGGTCVAIGSHSMDIGDGPDEMTCFVLSTGEVAIYSGDPSTTFAKVGSVFIPPPIGADCLVNLGGSLLVITNMGVVPLSVAMQSPTLDFLSLGNFGKVGPSLQHYAALYGGNKGWLMRTHQGRLIASIPTVATALSEQWVMNVLAGAWTRWQGFNAASMCEWNGDLYFGTWLAGNVCKVGSISDQGSSINLTLRQAFSAFGGEDISEVVAIRFDMSIDGLFSGAFGIDADYIDSAIITPSVTIVASTTTTPWGNSTAWGSAWATSSQTKGQWFGTYGVGRALGLALTGATQAPTLEWYGSQYLAKILGRGVG